MRIIGTGISPVRQFLWFCVISGTVCLFFVPTITLQFGSMRYTVSQWQLLSSAGFSLPERTGSLQIPLSLRCSVLFCPLSVLASAVLFRHHRIFPSAISAILSLLGPLLTVLSICSLGELFFLQTADVMTVQFHWTFLLILAGPICLLLTAFRQMGREQSAAKLCCFCAAGMLLCGIWLMGSLIKNSLPALHSIGWVQFLFGTEWNPAVGKFGILSMLLTTLLGTTGAILLAIPLSIATAVWLTVTAHRTIAALAEMLLELMAGIPSVVYGLLGLFYLVPVLRLLSDDSAGDSLLAAILLLAVFILPHCIISTKHALCALPSSLREGSFALGIGPMTTAWTVLLPAAKREISAGMLLAAGRAMGETMAILLVAGNAPQLPKLLQPVRFLTTGIAMELSYASGLHRQTLFAMGSVLMVLLLILQAAFTKLRQGGAA